MYDRDALIATTDLRALADELLGPHTGGERTPMWRCPNPQHAQTGRTPPVSVFNSHRGEPRWRCHGCGEGGTAIDLVMIRHGIGLRDALDELARRVGHLPAPPTGSRLVVLGENHVLLRVGAATPLASRTTSTPALPSCGSQKARPYAAG